MSGALPAELDTTPRGITVAVLGEPQPQGNKTAFAARAKVGGQYVYTGQVNVTEGRRPEARRAFKSWRAELTAAAVEAMGGEPCRLDGPLQIWLTCTMHRPAGHYGTGKNSGLLRSSAPAYPHVRPDGGKLQRAVEDALTDAGLWTDDSRVVDWHGFKRYPDPLASVVPRPFPMPWVYAPFPDALPVPGVVVRVFPKGD